MCTRSGDRETTLHLFFHCRFAQEVWLQVPWESTFDSSLSTSFVDELTSASRRRLLLPTGITINIFPWIIWFLWISRNQLTFERRKSTPSETVSKALRAALEWEHAQPPVAATIHRNHRLSQPIDLSPSTMICNTDGAWRVESRQAGTGWIFTSPTGAITRGGKSHLNVSSALMAEALAVRDALMHASALGFTSIWLRSDAQALTKAINSNQGPTELHGVLSDIASISSSSFDFCSFSFVSREMNGPADLIAKAHLVLANSSAVH
ncbi:uncharacterized protein LOC130509975 [Raphanus sativus]|uniref:Uncharacterized protein LOC130509975 n=1 Tax=Raphanus sativus TaxID=3726 RepID=A0A9W3DFT7_RAPSA|nr:uncharacterized protein LOC130509975 [Raphanus sativus]